MNKIIRAALTATFPGLNIDALLEVINATQNPVTATEKLIGVFEEPRLDPNWKYRTEERTLIGFEWNNSDDNQVKYSYPSKQTTTRYLTIEGAAKYDAAETDDSRREVMGRSAWSSNSQSDLHSERRELVVVNIYTSSCSVANWISGHFNAEI